MSKPVAKRHFRISPEQMADYAKIMDMDVSPEARVDMFRSLLIAKVRDLIVVTPLTPVSSPSFSDASC